ncbi:hypothetical protein ACS6GG_04935 [Enterobacter bugandensis]|nr:MULTISPECIES: hypothetical protein [Enterobacter]MCK6643007.1 hypothetical protein [Enterobacter bugandensis]MCK6962295.1 hypothetical protein [Enterobacter bugandensis]MCK7133802.1 hypothetical protein [Enterobacter bugandensis]MCM7633239.1 hypothetical protein [Enterobacter bugandensis]BBW27874.1 hypothetical protein STN0717ENT56_30300 [Enterobacter bugandensis]
MLKIIKWIIFFLLANIVKSDWLAIAALDESFFRSEQQRIDQEYRDDHVRYKNEQSHLPDRQRDKRLYTNEYWLVNKDQNLWIGFFEGKKIKVPKGVYLNISDESYQAQQVVRIKENRKISQFLMSSGMDEYPDICLNKNDKIMKDEKFYTYFYSGCTYDSLQRNSIKHDGHYDILLFDKRFNTLVKLDSIPYSIPEGLKYMSESLVSKNGYYRFDSAQGAFKITGKDQIVIVDPDTGNVVPKVPKTDDNGRTILMNGKPVMVDDPDSYNPVILKRLPDVTVAN